ncbi:MAG: phenylacetate-CoA oxygenase subunit PaaI [Gemmatimonadetes bacterium]|nr:phenylacetate-CoA oxygenase subunit PaaI [Gemmatimonadota bacterium]
MTEVLTSAGPLRPAVRDALCRQMLRLADSKRLLGIRYSDWLLGAPSIEAGIAASSMAQDEWGHARLLYAMLKDVGLDPVAVERDRPATAYANLPALDRPFSDWCAFVVANVVVDGALSVALQAFAAGGYEPARSRVPKMLAEEEFHRSHGVAWFRRLAGGAEAARARLRAESERMLPSTLAWVAPEDGAARLLAEEGVAGPGPEFLRRFLGDVGPVLERAGIETGAVAPDWQGWDAERGRGAGRPDDESVRRARGDRNRALFVE